MSVDLLLGLVGKKLFSTMLDRTPKIVVTVIPEVPSAVFLGEEIVANTNCTARVQLPS